MQISSGISSYNSSRAFYESRYESNYMDSWPDWKKERIKELIKSFNLPSSGSALDFGCGTGVLTRVLKDTLPSWDIWGTDVSETAIEKARIYCPD